jgi:hypothetical protein
MSNSIAVFLAIVALIAWAPHAIHNRSLIFIGGILTLVSLGISAMVPLIMMGSESSIIALVQFLGFASSAATVVAVGMVLFSVMPGAEPRRGRRHRSNDEDLGSEVEDGYE